MPFKTFSSLSLVLTLLFVAPGAHAQQLVKRMKCADFFVIAPIVHRHIGNEAKQVTIHIVKDSCRPKLPSGEFVVQMTGPGPGNGNHFLAQRYRGYSESLTLPLTPGDTFRVLFSRPFDVRASGSFDYTYTIH